MTITTVFKKTILLLILSFSFYSFSQSNKKFTVILDAGHGGKDPGNSYHGYVEKEIALKTTLKLEKYLKKDPNIVVVNTRKSDVFIGLKERPKKANAIDADLFVSIHCNSVDNPIPYGTETFVMGLTRSKGNLEIAKQENSVILLEKDYKQSYRGFDPKKPETLIGLKILQEDYLDRSINLASKIEKNFKNKLHRKSRGIKQTPLWVLDAAYMPSVLVELGFLSNNEEGSYLNSEEGQNSMAEAIASAIIAYKKEYSALGPDDTEKETSSTKITNHDTNDFSSNSKSKQTKTKKVLGSQELKGTNTNIIFKIQFAVGIKNITLKPANFRGLKNVSMTTSNGVLLKYMYGATSDYAVAKEDLKDVKAKGYNSAYIIAFKDGKSITIQEALK